MAISKPLLIAGVVLPLALAGAACSRTPDPAPMRKAPAEAALPAKFEDVLVYPAVEWDFVAVRDGEHRREHHAYPGRRAPFTMVLVPGNSANGIAPFYIGETEVTWELFRDWAFCHDLAVDEAQQEMDKQLRPSNFEGWVSPVMYGLSHPGYPALCMSRLTAEKFCAFLSQKTGRHYRLPSEAEWERAHAIGGGDPVTEEAKKEMAWCKENSDDYLRSDIPEANFLYAPAIAKVKTKKPNRLGLHDMLGNAAEWVDTGPIRGSRQTNDAGDGTAVRGGSFQTPVADLKGACRGVAEQEIWNATYPDNPKSIWWYKDHYQVGFRLACDPVNLPEKKP